MAQLQTFINLLEQEVANHSIYVWGAQGQTGSQITESWIRSRETSAKNANRAINFWRKQVAAGYGSKLKAFDCSGLGVWALQKCGLINYDTNANGLKNKCRAITKNQLRSGCFVFRCYSSGKAYHVGYVVDNNLNVIESMGRDRGVVKRPINASSSSYWNRFGEPPWFSSELGTVIGPTDVDYSGGGDYIAAIGDVIASIDSIANKYIITLDRSIKYPDFEKISKLGIIGVMIEAGQYFTPGHSEYAKFVNPNLDIQANWASNNNLPFALYTVCRAKNRIEAQKELKCFCDVIRLYPPVLGAWVSLAMTSTVSINDQILDVYKETLESIGLKNRIGLYTRPSSLSSITWSRHMNDWYLWTIDHVRDPGRLTGTYMPEFFQLGE